MTSPNPTSVIADGTLKVAWVPAISNPAAPTVAELTATGVIDLTCYLTPDGFTPGGDEQKINDDRLCSTQTYERPGRFSDTLDLRYVYQPQAASGVSDNKAYATLKRLTTGFIVERWGIDYSTAFATGQIVDVLPAQCGRQMKQPPEANSTLKVMQNIAVTGRVQRDVAVV